MKPIYEVQITFRVEAQDELEAEFEAGAYIALMTPEDILGNKGDCVGMTSYTRRSA